MSLKVFIHSNYISITKYDIVTWEEITMELREFLKKYLEDGKTIFSDGILQNHTSKQKEASSVTSENVNHTAFEKEIVSILKEYVQPAVASDGGHIAFESYNFTLKNGIETMLKEMLNDQALQVEAING